MHITSTFVLNSDISLMIKYWGFFLCEFGHVCNGDEATITNYQQAGSSCRSPLEEAAGIECKVILFLEIIVLLL